MASKAAQHKSELIERVQALAAARLSAERAAALSDFITQLYGNVAIDDLAGESRRAETIGKLTRGIACDHTKAQRKRPRHASDDRGAGRSARRRMARILRGFPR